MSSRSMQRLTLGIAVVALFAAVGGPSYAAKTVSKIRNDQLGCTTRSVPARSE